MKNIITYGCMVWLLAAAVLSCKGKSEIPSLKETFSKTDKNPFGTYAAYEQVRQLFYYNDVKTRKTTLEKTLESNYDTSALYINISKNLYLSQQDLDAVLGFVNKGNSIFLSSEYFDSTFLTTIGVPVMRSYNMFENFTNSMRNTAVQLHPAFYFDRSLFGYFYLPLDNSFALHQNESIKILGTTEDGKPNYAVVFYGKGRFYLHCEPRAFSNYFLLQKNNYQYLQQVFSFMPQVPEHVMWDDFYNKRNAPPSAGGERSGLSVLLQYPAMAWAFWLTLLLLLLYLLFGSKRRQRIIKPIPPNENTSVAFTETVGRLYLQKKDNRNIADKMITYFYEHIRNQYYLNTHQVNEEFISALSRKSNVPKEETEKLFRRINKVQQADQLGDQDLLLLNQQIENFYKQHQ